MSEPSKSLRWLVWGSLGLTIAAILVAFLIGQREIRNRERHGQEAGGHPASFLPVPLSIADFTLTNQDGQTVTRADLRGQLCLVDILFTRCAGPCPEMTRRMAELQTAIPTNLPVKFVSLTTDPGYDTPAVLQAYSRRFGAQPGRWQFL